MRNAGRGMRDVNLRLRGLSGVKAESPLKSILIFLAVSLFGLAGLRMVRRLLQGEKLCINYML